MSEVIGVYGVEEAKQPKYEYRAFKRPTANSGPEPRLFLVFRNQDYLILDYFDLESIGNPPGVDPNDVVLLRFRGSVPREVRIEGRRLLDAVQYLWRERVAWLKETPAGWDGYAVDSVAVITSINVRETASPTCR
jgi:hypothetical protein